MKCGICGHETLSVRTHADGAKRCDICQIAWLDVTLDGLIRVVDVLIKAAPVEAQERMKTAIADAVAKKRSRRGR